jgi:hypothetical protein
MLLEGLVDESKVALALDCWSSPQQLSFMGIVVYYIDRSWKLVSSLIGFEYLDGIHSGEELARVLTQCLRRYGIHQRISAITTDNASNNNTLVTGVQEMLDNIASSNLLGDKVQHIPCLAHIIQLALQALLGSIRLNPSNEQLLRNWQEDQELGELSELERSRGIAYTLAKVLDRD